MNTRCCRWNLDLVRWLLTEIHYATSHLHLTLSFTHTHARAHICVCVCALETLKRVLNLYVISNVLYGSKCWTFLSQIKRRLETEWCVVQLKTAKNIDEVWRKILTLRKLTPSIRINQLESLKHIIVERRLGECKTYRAYWRQEKQEEKLSKRLHFCEWMAG